MHPPPTTWEHYGCVYVYRLQQIMPAVLLVCQHSDPPCMRTPMGGNFYPSRLTWKDLREQLMCNCLSLKKKDKALVSLMKICTGIHLELHSQLTLNVCGLKRHAPILLACNILLKVFKIIFHKSMIYECLKLS